MSAFRAALRLSRHASWRAKGRSALIMVMIGLPVLVVTVATTLVATRDLDPRESLVWELGAADARVIDSGVTGPIRQGVMGSDWFKGDREKRRPLLNKREIETLFGAGARAIPAIEDYREYQTTDGYADAVVHEMDLRDPMTSGMVHLRQGRFPQAADEVVVSVPMRVGTGSTLHVTRDNTPMRVVGVVTDSPPLGVFNRLGGVDRRIIALPGALLTGPRGSNVWLVDAPAPVTWTQVRHANQSGLSVLSRAVLDTPPPIGDELDDAIPELDHGLDARKRMASLAAAIVVVEVVLLAGPAFAVGLRRRRRELALIAAQGGSPGQLKLIVVCDGLILGGGAAMLGAVLGVGIAWTLVTVVLGQWPEGEFGPFDVPFEQVIPTLALGTLSGLIAAVIPAVQAARLDVVAALAGRRGQVRDRAGRPLLGAVLIAAGLAATAYGVWHGTEPILAGAVLGQLGLVAATPRLISVIGGIAGRLPLPLRLAARDAARNRGRTAPAVAAVLAAAAGFSVISVVTVNELARRERIYMPGFSSGTLAVYGDDVSADSWREIRPIVDRTLPGVPLVEAWGVLDDKGRQLYPTLPDGQCNRCSTLVGSLGELPLGGPDLLRYALGRPDAAGEAALAAGKVVVFKPAAVRHGKVRLDLIARSMTMDDASAEISLPAAVVTVSGPTQIAGVAPPAAFASLGYSKKRIALLVDPAVRRLTPADEQRLSGPVRATTPKVAVTLEQGYRGDQGWALQVFAIAASVIVLGATFAATGLAAADSRPDLETLSAIGSRPGTRRLVVAAQAAVIAGVGVPAGLVAGLAPGIAMATNAEINSRFMRMVALNGYRYPRPGIEIDIPWPLLGVGAIGLPLVAALVAGLLARTRVRLSRRS